MRQRDSLWKPKQTLDKNRMLEGQSCSKMRLCDCIKIDLKKSGDGWWRATRAGHKKWLTSPLYKRTTRKPNIPCCSDRLQKFLSAWSTTCGSVLSVFTAQCFLLCLVTRWRCRCFRVTCPDGFHWGVGRRSWIRGHTTRGQHCTQSIFCSHFGAGTTICLWSLQQKQHDYNSSWFTTRFHVAFTINIKSGFCKGVKVVFGIINPFYLG